MSYATYVPPGLFGCYPAGLTVEQIHIFNRNVVERSARRWKEYVAIEVAHGIDQLPYEPRAFAFRLADALRASLEDGLAVEWGWKDRRLFPPLDPRPYAQVIAAYLSEDRLSPLLADIRQVAEQTALGMWTPCEVLFRQIH